MSKKRNIPLTRADKIAVYRKKNSAVRHEYYARIDKHVDKQKCMLNFTVSGKGRGIYTKLRLINEVKKYFTHLTNVAKAEIHYFANIEMGDNLSNPHLHIQVWHDDINSVQAIYDKVINKFSLNDKYCSLSLPQQPNKHYEYVIKDYSKDLPDNKLWNLMQIKERCRNTMGVKFRFYSKSKGKYTQKLYRLFYKTFGVIRKNADDFIEWFYSLFFRKQRVFKTSTILLKQYRINRLSVISIKNKMLFQIQNFGFVDFSTILLGVLFYSPSNSPPFLFTCLLCVLSYLVGVLMCWLCLLSLMFGFCGLMEESWGGSSYLLFFISLYFFLFIIYFVESRCCSPPLSFN